MLKEIIYYFPISLDTKKALKIEPNFFYLLVFDQATKVEKIRLKAKKFSQNAGVDFLFIGGVEKVEKQICTGMCQYGHGISLIFLLSKNPNHASLTVGTRIGLMDKCEMKAKESIWQRKLA